MRQVNIIEFEKAFIIPKIWIVDDRGQLCEIFTNDIVANEKYHTKHTYLTTCNPGVVKAWHQHKKQIDKFFCVKGKLMVLLADIKNNTWSKIVLSPIKPQLLVIEENIYHGFTAIAGEEAWVLNLATNTYNHNAPDEFRLQWDEILGSEVWLPRNK